MSEQSWNSFTTSGKVSDYLAYKQEKCVEQEVIRNGAGNIERDMQVSVRMGEIPNARVCNSHGSSIENTTHW
ncbi:MAG: hypothetical protein R3Y67_07910 [Eubacteriales bacterium]